MKNITPQHLRCTFGACPSVFRMEDGNLLIIGKKPSAELADEIRSRIGPGEQAVIIAPAYLAQTDEREATRDARTSAPLDTDAV